MHEMRNIVTVVTDVRGGLSVTRLKLAVVRAGSFGAAFAKYLLSLVNYQFSAIAAS